jgi:hypothetical protein
MEWPISIDCRKRAGHQIRLSQRHKQDLGATFQCKPRRNLARPYWQNVERPSLAAGDAMMGKARKARTPETEAKLSHYDELVELVEAFQSYLQDDSRSPRRRQACLQGCAEALAKVRA